MRLGAHVSTQGGVFNAAAYAAELGVTAIALFTKNQRQWRSKPLGEEEIKKWYQAIKEHGIVSAVSHVSYLINLCAPDKEKLARSLDSLTDELERAEILGLTHAVIHPGSHLGNGERWGINEIAKSLSEVHRRLPGYKAQITLEITAGQGSNLGYKFEQIAAIIDQTEENQRLAVCFDTCHAFAAGYKLTPEKTYYQTWEEFDRLIGLEKLAVIHLNDSKKESGSRVDRHEMIGDGVMGLEPFSLLLNDTRFTNLPAILETPQGQEGYPKDLKILRGLIRS